jgi:hypothetical protein
VGDLTGNVAPPGAGAQVAPSVALTAAAPNVAAGQVAFGNGTAATATAGSGAALPATVQAYLVVNIGGTNFKIPYFAV